MHDGQNENEALERAGGAAATLVRRIEDAGSLAPALDAVESAIETYEAQTGGTVDEILPPEVEALAFRRPSRERAMAILRAILCSERDELRPLVEGGLNVGFPALIAAIVAALSLPPAAFSLAAALAAVLATRNLDEFCEEETPLNAAAES